MYIYLHEWLILMVNVGIYTIHGSSGNGYQPLNQILGIIQVDKRTPQFFKAEERISTDFKP